MDPPDLGEHAAVRQAKAEAEEPQAELQESREEQKWSREGGMRGLGSRRGFSLPLFKDTAKFGHVYSFTGFSLLLDFIHFKKKAIEQHI